MSADVKQIKRKVLLLGDGAVGKTSLIHKFVTDKFDDKYISTIGTKVTKKDLRLKEKGCEILLTLMIWDVLGQKGYRSVQASSYKGGEGVLLVCDLTRKETLASLKEYWIPELTKVTGNIPKVFVGNKCDLVTERQISEDELEAFAAEFKAPYFLGSAKTGENVELIFGKLGEQVMCQRETEKPVEDTTWKRELSGLLDVADQIINDFCEAHGDRDVAMAVIRQQFSAASVDVEHPTKETLLKAVEKLAEIERGFKDDFAVKTTLAKRKRLIEEFG